MSEKKYRRPRSPLLAVLLVGVAVVLPLLPLVMSLADAMGVSANRL